MNTQTQTTPATRPQPRKIYEIKQERETMQSKLFAECGVFFAFSNEQFTANKTPLQEGEKYVSIGMGGYIPKNSLNKFLDGMKENRLWYNKEVRRNNARRQNIVYELANYECYYTGDIQPAIDALGAGYTTKEVLKVYNEERANHLND